MNGGFNMFNNDMELIKKYRELSNETDKVRFIHKYFWSEIKMQSDYNLDTSKLMKRKSLILKIFRYALEENNTVIIREMNLICIAISSKNNKKNKSLIRDYNKILIKTSPQYKKELEIK